MRNYSLVNLAITLSVTILAFKASAANITSHPSSLSVTRGAAATLSVTASSSGAISYQWQKDSVDIPGASSSSYNITSAQPWHVGDYKVKVTDVGGTVTSNLAELSLIGINTAIWKGLVAYYPFNGNTQDSTAFGAHGSPANSSAGSDRFGMAGKAWNFVSNVNSQIAVPKSPQHNFGAEMTVSIWAKFSQPWSYHVESLIWNRPAFQNYGFEVGVNQDDSSYGPGKYILGGFGGSFSSGGFKTVDGPFVAFSELSKWNMFTVTTSGGYIRMFVNGTFVNQTPVTGNLIDSPASLIIGGSSNPVSGAYNRAVDDVRLYNKALNSTEIAALYASEASIVITTPPESQTKTVTQEVTLSVVATGNGTLAYQWRKDGNDIPLANSATLIIASVNKLNEGAYDVVITDDNTSVTSNAAMLTVISPAIFTDPISRSGYAGQNTTFNVIAAGTGTVTYQWRKNGVNIPTATSSSLTLSPLNYRSAADYDVVVTDDFDTATSDPAELTVLSPAPNVSISPEDTTVALGGGLTFTAAVATGIPPYTYQWRKNGAAIAKATNATLVLTNIQRTQEGIYDVVVKNGHGVDVSNPARLSVPPLVPVNAAPASTDVNPAGTATFTVNVPGATAWQWLKNGAPIKGAITSTLNVPNVDASSVGLYSVTVTTPNGKVTTAPAQLRINDSGLLIYKLTGTGKAYEGAEATNAALSGYLVLDRAGQRGGLIIGSKSGSQNIHRLEIHDDLDTQSTGPVLKSQTVVSELVAGEFALWMDGTDGLLTISKTDKAVGPATMKGYANSIDLGSNVRIETVSLTLALDAVNSTPARLFQETVEQAMSRISQDMQAKGSALVE